MILFDEPTRGIDIGAKYDIYSIMNELAAEGKAIVMVSSEMAELLGIVICVVIMLLGIFGGIKRKKAHTAGAERFRASSSERRFWASLTRE